MADGADTTTTTTTTAASLVGLRYGEVLLARLTDQGLTADVYNSFPLNDCPDEQWRALDADAIAAEHGAVIAVLNGPRYWLMDRIDKVSSGPEERITFGGIEMIKRATVEVGDGPPGPYTPRRVNRGTTFTFEAGRQVYELVDPEGRCWVMQTWSQIVDPDLALADLAGLGDRLDLPEGWAYRVRTLDAPLQVVTTETTAQVLQDELANSYTLQAG